MGPIVGPLLLAMSPLLIGLVVGAWFLIRPAIRRRRSPSPDAQAIVMLLNEDVGGWSLRFGGHVLFHAATKIGLWVANEDYGLKWWIGEPADWDCAIRPPIQDQAHVWRVAKARRLFTGQISEAVNSALQPTPSP